MVELGGVRCLVHGHFDTWAEGGIEPPTLQLMEDPNFYIVEMNKIELLSPSGQEVCHCLTNKTIEHSKKNITQ